MTSSGQADHAVVIGASVAGLLTATVLAQNYTRVTVVDRDDLHDDPSPRRGVPQGRHAHVLLASGMQAIEELLPGILAELVADGAKRCRSLADIRFVIAGHELTREAPGATSCSPAGRSSRPASVAG